MEWIVRFIAVWILFFLLIDWKELKINIWCGVFSIILQLSMDTVFISNGFYKIGNPIVDILGSSLFFVLGPVFVVAILLSQFQPSKRGFQVIYVILLALIFDLEEYLLTIREEVIYINWNFLSSSIINFILMMSLSWFSIIVLKRGVKKL